MGSRPRRRPDPPRVPAQNGFSPAYVYLAGGIILFLGIGVMVMLRVQQVREITPDEITEAGTATAGSSGTPEQGEHGKVEATAASGEPEQGQSMSAQHAKGNDSSLPENAGDEQATSRASTATDSNQPDKTGASEPEASEISFAQLQTLPAALDSDRGRRLMADMRDVAVRIREFPEDSHGQIVDVIRTAVRQQLEASRLTYRGGENIPVMMIELTVSREAGDLLLKMSATLVARDREIVRVWSRSGTVAPITQQALEDGILPPNLERDARTFFRALRIDFDDARRQFRK